MRPLSSGGGGHKRKTSEVLSNDRGGKFNLEGV